VIAMIRALRGFGAPEIATWIGGALLLSVGILDWLWFSGMEIALLGAILAAMITAIIRAREASPSVRARWHWRAGMLGALLELCRPEAAVIIAPLAVCAAREARSHSAIRALFRVALPGALATLGILALNLACTGEAASAGALLKLLSSNPYHTDVDRARELLLNVLHFWWKVVETQMTAVPFMWWVLPLLALSSVIDRKTRAIAVALFVSIFLWIALVSWNGAARYQNFRYYMPAIALLLMACTLGLRALWRRPISRAIGASLALVGAGSALVRLPAQIRFFRECSENIHHQQIAIAKKLPEFHPTRVLVGDAGAIPYVSGVPAIDALGLGGFRGLPWARAATQGEASTIELVQSLSPSDRPSHLVLYPNWFGGITSAFGRELVRVTLAHNVICGGPSKAIYAADWRALDERDAPEGIADEIDVADVVSEREHDYASPAPYGGWTKITILLSSAHVPMFDGGRTILAEHPEAFTIKADGSAIVVRAESWVPADAIIRRGNAIEIVPLRPIPSSGPSEWTYARAFPRNGLRAGDRVSIAPHESPFYDHHVFVIR
jgi:hypothetical protein